MKTYDIYFNDSENSSNKGFSLTKEEAISYAERLLVTGDSYVSDYKGGVISVECNETGDTVWERAIV